MSFDTEGHTPASAADGASIDHELFVPVVIQTRHVPDDPVIGRLRDLLTNIQANELQRLYNRLPNLDERARDAIRQLADCLVGTVLQPPTDSLRSESKESQALAHALSRLFKLS
jgi:glutamyl-tRNA reductase